MKKLYVYLFLLFNFQFLIAQWDTVAIIESNAFAHSDGWTGSFNGSPWDCSDASIQKNPAAGDFVYVPETLETGYLYRYTYYVKAREPQVLCEFREGSEISAEGNALDYAYNQQGDTNYVYVSGAFDVNAAPAMVCGNEFKYTSGPVTGDGEIHYLKVVVTDVLGIGSTKPLRVAHCLIERRIDPEYPFPLPPTDLNLVNVSGFDAELEWTDNSFNEAGFVVEASFDGGNFAPLDTLDANLTSGVVSLPEAGNYELRMYAFNNEGNSVPTNNVSTGIYAAAPTSPSEFTGIALTSRRIDLEWTDNSDNENGFIVEVSSAGGEYTEVAESPLEPNTTSLSMFSLDALTEYSIRLFAFNNMGSSDTVVINIQTPDPSGDGVIFPEDAGILNVRDFGAVGDGVTDDTEAIQAAMNVASSRFVYFPIGTYLLSDRLEWPSEARVSPLILIGQDKERCIIKLTDNNLQYQNASSPRSLIWTQEMSSADNFRNFIRKLTINTGSGNPGAIGIQFMSNNMGSVSNVDIISEDGGGVTGLDLAYNSLNGPLLISEVRISGFDTGIKASGAVNSQTLEHITLENQKSVGIYNSGQVLSVRDIQTVNVPLAVHNSSSEGVLTLIDGVFNGGTTEYPAIVNQGLLFGRNLQSDGYEKILRNLAGSFEDVDNDVIEEFTSHEKYTLFPWTNPKSLDLEIKDTPEIPWESDFSQWANVEDYGAIRDDSNDDTQAIQDAINSGKTHIYFPLGVYNVSGSIELTGSVERIVGLESNISVGTQSEAVFVMDDNSGASSMVEIQHLSVTPTNPTPAVNNRSSNRTLIVRYCKGFGGTHTGTGEVYYEDVGTGVHKPIKFAGGEGQRAWIRQLSNEPREGVTHFMNEGATVWMLGHKTEMPGTLVETTGGGKTEICGAFAYSVGGDNSEYPMYVNDSSSMSITMGGAFFASGYGTYNTIVSETQNSDTRELKASSLPTRAGFRMMALYVGYPDDGTAAVPDGPTNLVAETYSETEITISWEDNSYNETGFGIEFRTAEGNFEVLDTTNTGATQVMVIGLNPGEIYCFRVFAFNELGNSAYTNEACDTTLFTDAIPQTSNKDVNIRVYPNPFTDEVTLSFSLKSPTEVNIDIYDMTGRTVTQINHPAAEAGNLSVKWDGSDMKGNKLEEGIYFARITMKDVAGHISAKTVKLVLK